MDAAAAVSMLGNDGGRRFAPSALRAAAGSSDFCLQYSRFSIRNSFLLP